MELPPGTGRDSRFNMNFNMPILNSETSDMFNNANPGRSTATTLGTTSLSRSSIGACGTNIPCGIKRTASVEELEHDLPRSRLTSQSGMGIAGECSSDGAGDFHQTQPKKTLPPNGKKTKGRVKIKMEFIDNKLRRYTTFSKRKTGIMKKAYELSTLTGTQVMLLVASETGHVYTFATRKLQPMITSEAGKALIQTCLNSPDPPPSSAGSHDQRMSATGFEETELTYNINEEEQKDTLSPKSDQGFSDSSRNGSVSPEQGDSPAGNADGVAVSSASSSIHPPLIATSMVVGSGSSTLSYPGAVMYQTQQGVVYAAPNSGLPNGVIFSPVQLTSQGQGQGQDQGNSAGSSSQHFITIPLPVSLASSTQASLDGSKPSAEDLTMSRK